MGRLFAAMCVILGGMVGGCWGSPDSPYPPGVLEETGVSQTAVTTPTVFEHGEWKLTALAHYDITALIFGTERYRRDPAAVLSPVDFAAAWGPMSDSAVLNRLRFSQGGRFLSLTCDRPLGVETRTIERHIANIHIIPADDTTHEQVLAVRPGEVVRLTGHLISARSQIDPNRVWRSSLYRSDNGGGACEVLRVQTVEVIRRP